MNYQTVPTKSRFEFSCELLLKFGVSIQNDTGRQQIIPNGRIEMTFTLGNDIKRYTSKDEFILQPRVKKS